MCSVEGFQHQDFTVMESDVEMEGDVDENAGEAVNGRWTMVAVIRVGGLCVRRGWKPYTIDMQIQGLGSLGQDQLTPKSIVNLSCTCIYRSPLLSPSDI